MNKIQQAAAQTAMKAQSGGNPTMQQYIKQMEGEIKKALPSVMTPERFTRITLSALSTNPKLAQCTPQSFLGAMMTAAQLGLEPNTPLGQAYLIPYWNGKQNRLECQFQLGYKGMIDLAYRSGEIQTIQAQIGHANDTLIAEYGTECSLKFIPKLNGDRGDPVNVWAMFKTKDGGYGFEIMTLDDVRAHAQKYSKAYSSGPWQTNFEEMAKKTVLKKVLKYAPMKSDFVRQIAQDSTVKTEISDDMFTVPTVVVDAEMVADIPVDLDTGEVQNG